MSDSEYQEMLDGSRRVFDHRKTITINRERIVDHLLSKGYGIATIAEYLDEIMRKLHIDSEVAV